MSAPIRLSPRERKILGQLADGVMVIAPPRFLKEESGRVPSGVFDSLVRAGALTDDGELTERGRRMAGGGVR